MIELLQYAKLRQLGINASYDNRTQPAILCINGQPFTSNVPSSETEKIDINLSIDKHIAENERIRQ